MQKTEKFKKIYIYRDSTHKKTIVMVRDTIREGVRHMDSSGGMLAIWFSTTTSSSIFYFNFDEISMVLSFAFSFFLPLSLMCFRIRRMDLSTNAPTQIR